METGLDAREIFAFTPSVSRPESIPTYVTGIYGWVKILKPKMVEGDQRNGHSGLPFQKSVAGLQLINSLTLRVNQCVMSASQMWTDDCPKNNKIIRTSITEKL